MPNVDGMDQKIIINFQRDEKRLDKTKFSPKNKWIPNNKVIHPNNKGIFSNTQTDAQQKRNSS